MLIIEEGNSTCISCLLLFFNKLIIDSGKNKHHVNHSVNEAFHDFQNSPSMHY